MRKGGKGLKKKNKNKKRKKNKKKNKRKKENLLKKGLTKGMHAKICAFVQGCHKSKLGEIFDIRDGVLHSGANAQPQRVDNFWLCGPIQREKNC